MYVWVDALTNYITGVGFPDIGGEKFKRYWPAALHVIGKDIVRFHAVYWPAFLLSAGIAVPQRIFSHGFLFNRGEKMSKSVGNVIDPFALADAYGVDQLRYFFLREVPFGQDGNYSHEAIVNRINADLANDLGNLAQRSLSMIGKACGGTLPEPGAFTHGQDDPGGRRRDDRNGARAHEDAAVAPGAQCRLGRGGRCQPLFRIGRALGHGEDRSEAAGHDPLRDRRSAAAGRHPGAAIRAGGGGQNARSTGDGRRRTRALPRLAPGRRIKAGANCRRLSRFFRAMSKRKKRPESSRRAIATPHPMLVDSHCHLDFPDFASELDEVVARARAAGIGRIVTISTRVKKHAQVLAIADKFSDVFCSVGTHPHNAQEETDITAQDLIALPNIPKSWRSARPGSTTTTTKSARFTGEKLPRAYRRRARNRPAAGHSFARLRR